MTDRSTRTVPAVHGTREIEPDAAFERGLAEHLRTRHDSRGLMGLYGRFVHGGVGFRRDDASRRCCGRSWNPWATA